MRSCLSLTWPAHGPLKVSFPAWQDLLGRRVGRTPGPGRRSLCSGPASSMGTVQAPRWLRHSPVLRTGAGLPARSQPPKLLMAWRRSRGRGGFTWLFAFGSPGWWAGVSCREAVFGGGEWRGSEGGGEDTRWSGVAAGLGTPLPWAHTLPSSPGTLPCPHGLELVELPPSSCPFVRK